MKTKHFTDTDKTSHEINMSKIIFGILLSIVSGFMFLFAFHAYGGFWFLAPFAVAPMVVAQ